MLIDKVEPFYTEEERQETQRLLTRSAELLREGNNYTAESAAAKAEGDEARAESLALLAEFSMREYDDDSDLIGEISDIALKRYADAFRLGDDVDEPPDENIRVVMYRAHTLNLGDISAVLADVRDVISATDKGEYIAYQEQRTKHFSSTADSAEGWTNCRRFLIIRIRHQLTVLSYYGVPDDDAIAIVEAACDVWYEREGTPPQVDQQLSPRKRAEQQGALLSLGNHKRQVTITEGDLQSALSLKINRTAYLAVFTPEQLERLEVESRKLRGGGGDGYSAKVARAIAKESMLNAVKDIDLPLVRNFYTAVYAKAKASGLENSIMTIYMPSFFRDMGIEVRDENASVLEKIHKCVNLYGVMYNEMFPVVKVDRINYADGVITVDCPYLLQLCRAMDNIDTTAQVGKGKSKADYEIPGYTWLIHADIAKERNKAAVEIVTRIVAGLGRRGVTSPNAIIPQQEGDTTLPDIRIFRYEIIFSTLMDEVPNLKVQYERNKKTADKNKFLRRTWLAVLDILKNCTDVYDNYVDFEVHFADNKVPTSSKLNKKVYISHKGKNPEFKLPD